MAKLASNAHLANQKYVSVSASQFACGPDVEDNLRRAETEVRDAARRGANVVLLQELFASVYFPIEQMDSFRLAVSIDDDKSYLVRFQELARELAVVIPVSFFERANNAYFNSIVVFDADGSNLGIYRKSHIPNSPGYHEAQHFAPGDTGFRVFRTRFATIGVGICWDQWFPEAARCMALQGAEILLYPTAIGSEPQHPSLDTSSQWRRCMQGHAAANLIPIVAANRVGKEMAATSDVSITFYGSSFFTDHTGAIVVDAGRHQQITLVHTYNLDEMRSARHNWGVFRDRRPELYTALFSFDGTSAGDMHERRAPILPAAPRVGVPVGAGPATMSVPGLPLKKDIPPVVAEPPIINPHQIVPQESQRAMAANTFDLHEATFIGDVRASAQRRPRGRCWACRAKTTYECKLCAPGPVPLCNRTARECWWKYHAGEITQFVPNKRGRKRSLKSSLGGADVGGDHDGEDTDGDECEGGKAVPETTLLG